MKQKLEISGKHEGKEGLEKLILAGYTGGRRIRGAEYIQPSLCECMTEK